VRDIERHQRVKAVAPRRDVVSVLASATSAASNPAIICGQTARALASGRTISSRDGCGIIQCGKLTGACFLGERCRDHRITSTASRGKSARDAVGGRRGSHRLEDPPRLTKGIITFPFP